MSKVYIVRNLDCTPDDVVAFCSTPEKAEVFYNYHTLILKRENVVISEAYFDEEYQGYCRTYKPGKE